MIKYKNTFISIFLRAISPQYPSNSYYSPYTYPIDMITSIFKDHYNSNIETISISNYAYSKVNNNNKSEKFNKILFQLSNIN